MKAAKYLEPSPSSSQTIWNRARTRTRKVRAPLDLLEHYLPRFMESEATQNCHTHSRSSSVAMCMNGCDAKPFSPIANVDCRTLTAAPSLALAMDALFSALTHFKLHPPPFCSGLLRLQVPITESIEAIDWLHAQQQLAPRCFFSRRSDSHLLDTVINKNGSHHVSSSSHQLISVAGVGSAVFFRHLHPFSYHHWKSIKRFLSSKFPLIRAYGAIRFDARANVSSEWEEFGSFYFMIPQCMLLVLDGKCRSSLMSLKEVPCWPQLSRGIITFP